MKKAYLLKLELTAYLPAILAFLAIQEAENLTLSPVYIITYFKNMVIIRHLKRMPNFF